MSKYRRIRYEDLCQIYALSKRDASQESVARILGVSQSAVSREMRRNRGQRGYRFKQAEATAQARQAIRGKPRKLTAPIRRKIEVKLRQMRWSPEQISGWLSEQGIKLSHERIYQMIWDDWPAPSSEDTELGVFMEPEVSHGKTKVYAGVQA